ncbi:hypothetical protein POM88_001872 [Heracleum sosnowskyi]|uniref:TF-B3 domain-containing protein n=1 Tax=Heracleum sosnowskyi TaxID=360622 RepID=A0AAD8JGZ9_9APIA|nr:hypothetical protein POM88_001872 [Heracleum sosnowskyi]
MNHFRDDDGYFRFVDFTGPCCSEDLVEVSDSSRASEDINDSSSDDKRSNGDVADLEMFSFNVTLRLSHVDQQCHGAYLSGILRPVYRTWRKRTSTLLYFRGTEWNVEVLRSNRSCRFGVGWDEFILHNGLIMDQKLCFEYVGDYTFHVSVVD